MMRKVGLVLLVLLLLVASPVVWLTGSQSGLRWAYEHGKAYVPGELSVGNLEGYLTGPMSIKGLRYENKGVMVEAKTVELDWSPASLLAAQFRISHLDAQAVKVTLPPKDLTGKSDQVKQLPVIYLPWRLALEDTRIQGLRVEQDGRGLDIKEVRLAASSLFSNVQIDRFQVEAETFSVNLQGELNTSKNYRHSLELHWMYRLPSKAMLEGTGHMKGDMARLSLQQAVSGPVKLNLEAQVRDVLQDLNWQAKIKATSSNLSLLDARLPAASGNLSTEGRGNLTEAAFTGKLGGDYPQVGPFSANFKLQREGRNSIYIDSLNLHAPTSDTRIHARGRWTPGAKGGSTDLALTWQNLRWPLTGKAWFDSALGSGWVEGSLDHYRLGLATDRPWPQAPPSDWYASADGDAKGLDFHALRIEALDGAATAKGPLTWSPAFHWQAQVAAAGIDPAGLWPQWPGRLRGNFTSSGGIENHQLVAQAQVENIQGELRGYPVSLQGKLGWRDKGLDLEKMHFRSGASEVKLQGRIADTLALTWSTDASNLAELYPGAKGRLQAEGKISGPRTTPYIEVTHLQGQGLGLPDYGVERIEGKLALDLFRWQQVDVQLSAQGVRLKERTLRTLQVTADSHHLSAKAESKTLNAQVELEGEAVADGWSGRLVKADMQSPRFKDWHLESPVKLVLGINTLQTGKLCWRSGEARLCAKVDGKGQQWASDLTLDRFPLAVMEPWLPADMDLQGLVDAQAALQWQRPDQLRGQVSLKLPPGAVNYPLVEGERERWEYQGGNLQVSLHEAGITATTELVLGNGDRLTGNLVLPGANLLNLDWQHQPLEAKARLKLHQLGVLEALVLEVQDLKGEAELNLTAGGTLGKPKFSGRFQLHKGSLRVPRLGLTIDQIKLDGQSDGLNTVNYRLLAHSGEGSLTIQGRTQLEKDTGWPSEITVEGKNFEVSRIPEARVQVSPKLQITVQHHTIHVDGKVHIPYAKLQPKDITTAARTSNDVVIINGQQVKTERWSIYTRIRLTLGKRVTLFGFGFDGRLGGSLLLEDEPGQLTSATGEITVPEGKYSAYGQHLEVEQGRLLYTGGPITNPGLDLQAVRHVGDVTAGLRVKGSLKQPQVELFSIPAMGQTDALAYLMLGRPIESASGEDGAMLAQAALALGLSSGDRLARSLGERFGLDEVRVESGGTGDQASLVMGRYLSPKLYISYSVGLIQAINTFTVRYEISRHWQLRGESGENQGADLLYTIER